MSGIQFLILVGMILVGSLALIGLLALVLRIIDKIEARHDQERGPRR